MPNRVKLVTALLLLFTSLPCLKSQETSEMQHLRDLVEKQEELRFLSVSGNGKWISWQSVYESRPSELKVASVHHKKVVLTKPGVSYWQFIRDHKLVYSFGTDTKYEDLQTGKQIAFSDVKAVGFVKLLDLFYVHYNEKKSGLVEFYDKRMNLVQRVPDVKRVIVLANEVMIIQQKGSWQELLKYEGKDIVKVFESDQEIYAVSKSGLDKRGWLVTVRKGKKFSMYCINDGGGNPELLSYNGKAEFDGIQQHTSSDLSAILIDLQTLEPLQKGIVDIWYGKDFDLEDHFRDRRKTVRVLWYPEENKVVDTSEDNYSDVAALGKTGLFIRTEIDSTQVDSNDLNAKETVRRYFLYDPLEKFKRKLESKTDRSGMTILAETSKPLITDSTGAFVLYRKEKSWFVRKTKDLSFLPRKLDFPADAVPYFISDREVLWVEGEMLWKQDLVTFRKKLLKTLPDSDIEILNATIEKSLLQNNVLIHQVDISKGLLLKLTSGKDWSSSVVLWHKNKLKVVVPKTADRISDPVWDQKGKNYFWFSENYNKSPEICGKLSSGSSETFYSSSSASNTFRITMKRLHYKGIEGDDLTALLFYPPNFSPDKKYPVVVSIYEMQHQNHNKYLLPTFKNSRGFNERLFLELGYMVLLPDINNTGDQGPGIAALHCVNAALDELQEVGQADMRRVGLLGQSFGGYETNFIATQSDRFAAYVSGASISDIINTSFAFNYNFFSADYYRYEDGQFKLGKFTDNKEKYYRNNPLYFADHLKSPMLLWTGTADRNVNPEQTRSFYNALRKYRKPVVALFYKDELHSLMEMEQRNDLTVKMIEWFDYFLRRQKLAGWIRINF